LISLGVYLGLILRLNSWDLVSDPDSVFLPISKIPGNHLLLVVLVVFALFLWGLYEALDIWVDGMLLRWEVIAKRHNGGPSPAAGRPKGRNRSKKA
jgi:uncharacterized membrane protein